MKNKFYSFILTIFCCGLWTARAQDSTSCNAQFTTFVSGDQVTFHAMDSAAGLQHFWNFGDSSQIGFGPFPTVTHTYSHAGTFLVVHLVRDSATGCNDSSSQLVTIGAPPPQCSISYIVSHDSTQPGQPYLFFAQPNLAGATSDTLTWTVNDTIAGTGDTLIRTFQPGAYTVCANLVTNLGCQSQYCQTIQVSDTVPPPPPPQCSISITISHDSTKKHQPYFFSAQSNLAGATSGQVTWTINDKFAGNGNSMTRAFQPGVYTVCADLVTNLGCQSETCQTINVSDTADDSPVTDTSGQSLRCYPNPAYSQTNVVIQLDKPEMIFVRVYNGIGSEVEVLTVPGPAGTNTVSVPLGSLQPGIYYIQLQYGNEIKRSMIQKL